MAERLIEAAETVLGQLADKVPVTGADELQAASDDMKRILDELKEQVEKAASAGEK